MDPVFTQNGWGRVVTVQYGGQACPSGMHFTEMYSYAAAGLKTKKKLRVKRWVDNQPYEQDLDAGYSWTNEGQMASVTHPQAWFGDTLSALTTYTYSFDSMGRPNKLAYNYNPNPGLVPNVTYGPAGEMLQMQGWETRQYNILGQLTRLTGGMDIEYEMTIGSFGSANVFYGVDISQIWPHSVRARSPRWPRPPIRRPVVKDRY